MKWIPIFALALSAAAQERTFVFTSEAKYEFEGKVVTGAPYSAQAVTETTQVLADGNRITRKTSSFIARDSQGRTRREQSLSKVGPWATNEPNGRAAFINDPVAGVRYSLLPDAKSAVKMPMNTEAQQLERKLKEVARAKEAAEGRTKEAAETLVTRKKLEEPNIPTTESLGTRAFDGVVAEGKRTTETIAAGRIGNEKPIEIVNETWYSQELQTVVMSKHSDPRSGEVVYTLTNISRAEPDPSLFTVPPDYKMKEEGRFEMREVRK